MRIHIQQLVLKRHRKANQWSCTTVGLQLRVRYQRNTPADVCISFTEEPRSSNSRGGRHVEFGAALAAGKFCIVIGPRENVFHCLPRVKVLPSWDALQEII